MTCRSERAVVVVGADEASADDAVCWAAAEAAVRGCALRIVHAFRPPLPADPYGCAAHVDDFLPVRVAAEIVLRRAVARARSVASDIDVSVRLAPGSAARALIGEAGDARLLVVGSHGRSGLRGLLAGSVSIHAATRARCPVVVVPPSAAGAGEAPPRVAARVVVGVDRTASCAPAVEFAFQAARQRGIPLAAVHTWTADPIATSRAVSGAQADAEARGVLDAALAPCAREYPGVRIVAVPVRGDPARALIGASRGAALLVVGSRGRGHLRGTMFGSVSQTVLSHARCPVAIVHRGRGVNTRPPTGMQRGMAC